LGAESSSLAVALEGGSATNLGEGGFAGPGYRLLPDCGGIRFLWFRPFSEAEACDYSDQDRGGDGDGRAYAPGA
jgi:hypothetical protein